MKRIQWQALACSLSGLLSIVPVASRAELVDSSITLDFDARLSSNLSSFRSSIGLVGYSYVSQSASSTYNRIVGLGDSTLTGPKQAEADFGLGHVALSSLSQTDALTSRGSFRSAIEFGGPIPSPASSVCAVRKCGLYDTLVFEFNAVLAPGDSVSLEGSYAMRTSNLLEPTEEISVISSVSSQGIDSAPHDDLNGSGFITRSFSTSFVNTSGDYRLVSASIEGDSYVTWTGAVLAVPEPRTSALFLGGLLLIGAQAGYRTRASSAKGPSRAVNADDET